MRKVTLQLQKENETKNISIKKDSSIYKNNEEISMKRSEDPMQAQLDEFMAEIDSLSKPIQPKKKNVAKQTEIKDEVSTPSIITDEKKIDDKIQKLNGTSEVHVQEELEDVLDKPVLPPQPDKPLAPESNWQAVFDDKHQSYYYWDTRGGRCVWEVPAEYQDFLQAYQDFEVSMVKYEEEFQEWQRKCEKVKKKIEDEKKKKGNQKSKNETITTISLVNYSVNEDDDYEDEEEKRYDDDNKKDVDKKINDEIEVESDDKKRKFEKDDEVKKVKKLKFDFEVVADVEERSYLEQMRMLRHLTDKIQVFSSYLDIGQSLPLLEALIAAKTRMHDWREGRLSLGYLLGRLQENVDVLRRWEEEDENYDVIMDGERDLKELTNQDTKAGELVSFVEPQLSANIEPILHLPLPSTENDGELEEGETLDDEEEEKEKDEFKDFDNDKCISAEATFYNKINEMKNDESDEVDFNFKFGKNNDDVRNKNTDDDNKKNKDFPKKNMLSTSKQVSIKKLSMKKRGVHSMVEKWNKIREVEKS